MNNREIKLNEMFKAIRPRMVRKFARNFASVGADVEDALAKAFERVGGNLLARGGEIDETEFGFRIYGKMRRLAQDAWKLSRLAHGRKSVKARESLDIEADDGDEYFVPTIDKVSFARYAERDSDDHLEKHFQLKTRAIEQVMKENGVSDRDYEIFDRVSFRAADRKVLAEELGTSVGNVNRIVCIFKKRLDGCLDAVRERYAKLAAEDYLEAV